MKAILTVLLSSLMTASVWAGDGGRITVSFSGNKNFTVAIDGSNYYPDNAYTAVDLSNVSIGHHTIEVYNNRNNNRWNNNAVVSSNTFVVRPQYDVLITVDRYGQVQLQERRSAYYDGTNGNGHDRNRGLNNGNSYDKGNRDHDGDDDDYRRDRRNNNYGEGNNRGYDNNGYGNNRGAGNTYKTPINENDFNRVIQIINRQWTPGAELNSAKDAINRNNFTTYQVRQILQLFRAENDRLALAKLAYSNTVDPRNYNQLYDVFSYQSSRNELDRYIRNARY